jgi:release factor glutamine methyltransferase
MTNSKELFNQLVNCITLQEEKNEIQSIVYLLLENKLGLSKIDILSGKIIDLPDQLQFDQDLIRINNQEPIQYILGKEDFYGRSFAVNPAVLIPRPETELLIHEIKKYVNQQNKRNLRILDIGTGSGCIAITLALEIPDAEISTMDVSNEALACARKNASELTASVVFENLDILKEEINNRFDLIVSNPPYIASSEKESMKRNVLHFEPHLALFVPENDALLFYRVIGLKSKSALTPGGSLWFEINENFGKEVKYLLEEQGYNVQIQKDLDNKDRIVIAHL